MMMTVVLKVQPRVPVSLSFFILTFSATEKHQLSIKADENMLDMTSLG